MRLGSRGFSILEILIGMAVFMIGMLGVTMLQISVVKGNAFAGNLTEATVMAQDTFEDLMNMDWDDADLNDTDGNGNAGITAACDVANRDQPVAAPVGDGTNNKYTVWWDVADESMISRSKTVRVCVQWVVKGEPYNFELTRLIPRR